MGKHGFLKNTNKNELLEDHADIPYRLKKIS